jgi:cholest-4-en-3-one 26-monooxygenase
MVVAVCAPLVGCAPFVPLVRAVPPSGIVPIDGMRAPAYRRLHMVAPAFDLTDSTNFISGVPHERFAELRRQGVVWLDEPLGGPGFWAVTRYPDCVTVNRDFEHFSSARRAVYLWDIPDEELAQQQLMMLNMDPPLHTRYRRLVNKGFTPRMVSQLETHIHETADDIIDAVIEAGTADFVTDLCAELPLIVIAELLGVPREDRHRVFDWSNQMIGNEDPEFAVGADRAAQSAMELYAYASALYAEKRLDPHSDLMSVLTEVEVEGERLSDLDLELFFLLLSVAGNETTRNLMAGGMQAFFDHPDQWKRLLEDRSLLPTAIEEMLRFVTPVMNFRRQTTGPIVIGGQEIEADQKMVFFHISANRDETVFDDPMAFDIGRDPNPHIAFGGGGPHFCLGANLARMEIRVMFEHLLDRVPDLTQAGPAARLQSNFINGIKHLPVAFTPAARKN